MEVIFNDIQNEIGFIDEDRQIDHHLRNIIDDIRAQRWDLY